MITGRTVLASAAIFVIGLITALLVMHMAGVPGLPYLGDTSP